MSDEAREVAEDEERPAATDVPEAGERRASTVGLASLLAAAALVALAVFALSFMRGCQNPLSAQRQTALPPHTLGWIAGIDPKTTWEVSFTKKGVWRNTSDYTEVIITLRGHKAISGNNDIDGLAGSNYVVARVRASDLERIPQAGIADGVLTLVSAPGLTGKKAYAFLLLDVTPR